MARLSMVAAARDLLGVPFLHRGRTRAGLDCAGMVWLARKTAYGLTADDRNYPARPSSQMVLSKISRHGVRIGVREALPGDVVILQFGSFATHLGVLTPEGVVHSVPTLGVIETSRADLAASRSIRAVFRLAGSPWPS